MTDYERIAMAIHFIRTHAHLQPSLSAIASHIGLSSSHFQRLFSRWAGISPKRFLQTLTLEYAQQLLQDTNMSVFDVSTDVGLSSGSRLYDHFVQLTAVTPAEYKQQGEGLDIFFGIHSTPFGRAFIAVTARGICQLIFIDKQTKQQLVHHLIQTWPLAGCIEDVQQTAEIIGQLFLLEPSNDKPLSLWVKGTNFQINVWRALLNIPEGNLQSYKNIAQQIGKPKATRAVGTAIGANPVAFLIPCHRVIKQSGELGGYRWGITRKQAMIARETTKQNG
jgi:AraC family transcriptional regulator, regulatory protein of adaptative response / methylated-DNA-[protein]-cysteine methyltransferase